jgi:hypothetical protein
MDSEYDISEYGIGPVGPPTADTCGWPGPGGPCPQVDPQFCVTHAANYGPDDDDPNWIAEQHRLGSA